MLSKQLKDSDKILKKLAEERNDEALNSEDSKKVVEEFMNLFKKDSGIG